MHMTPVLPRRLPVSTVAPVRGIQIDEFGGPELLVVRDIPDPTPNKGQEVMTVLAAGVNYADTRQTENSYLARPTLPLIAGGEVFGRTPDKRGRPALITSGGY